MTKKIHVAHRGVGEGKEPIATEVIAESIVELADGMRRFRSGRLNERALIVLLQDATSLSKREIKLVLDSLAALDEMFLKKKGKE